MRTRADRMLQSVKDRINEERERYAYALKPGIIGELKGKRADVVANLGFIDTGLVQCLPLSEAGSTFLVEEFSGADISPEAGEQDPDEYQKNALAVTGLDYWLVLSIPMWGQLLRVARAKGISVDIREDLTLTERIRLTQGEPPTDEEIRENLGDVLPEGATITRVTLPGGHQGAIIAKPGSETEVSAFVESLTKGAQPKDEWAIPSDTEQSEREEAVAHIGDLISTVARLYAVTGPLLAPFLSEGYQGARPKDVPTPETADVRATVNQMQGLVLLNANTSEGNEFLERMERAMGVVRKDPSGGFLASALHWPTICHSAAIAGTVIYSRGVERMCGHTDEEHQRLRDEGREHDPS